DTRWVSDWSSDVCSSDLARGGLGVLLGDLGEAAGEVVAVVLGGLEQAVLLDDGEHGARRGRGQGVAAERGAVRAGRERVAEALEIGRASCRERGEACERR